MDARLDSITSILAANELPLTWRSIIGDPVAPTGDGAHAPDYDDASWPEGWKGLQGERWDTAWLRATLPHCPLITGDLRGTTVPGGFVAVWVDGEQVAEGFDPDFALAAGSVAGDRVIALRSRMGELSHEHEQLVVWESDSLRQVQRARRSLEFVRAWRTAQPRHADAIDDVLRRYADVVDPEVYAGAPSVFWQDVLAATELLAELNDLAKEYTVHIVPHSHVDLAWGWTYDETKRISRSLFDMALRLMDEDPEYTFSQEQPPMYEHLEGSATENAIRERIEEGRWDIPGATYSEPESFMTGGESWVRHMLYAKRYFRERVGHDIRIHWAPDNFSGHANTLPQIWRKCGIDCFAFGNWYQADHGGQFLWEGLDGSRVFAHYFTGHYDSAQMIDQDKVVRNVCAHMSNTSLDRCMLLDGDDLTPPWPESPAGVAQLRELAAFPKVQFSTPRRFFDGLSEDSPEAEGMRVVQGEFISTVGERHNNVGAYTSFVEVKRRNRQLEWMLRTAETLAAFAGEYPADWLDRAWKGVLLNQMHDIFPGTAIHEAYDEAHRRYDEAEQTCVDVIDHAANALSRDIDTQGEGIPVVLWNTLGWDRSDAAEIVLTEAHSYLEGFQVVDGEGADVPAQILETSIGTFDKTNKTYRMLVQPDDVPAGGYRTVWLRPAYVQESTYAASMVGPDALTLDNDYVRVTIDPRTGWVDEFFDKRVGVNIVPDGMQACVLELQRDMGNPWHLAPEGPPWLANETVGTEVIEDGDVRAAIRVTTTWHRSTFVQEFRIYRNSARLEVLAHVDLHESEVVLKSLVPTPFGNSGRWSCEVPWGVVERDVPDNDRAAQTWVDLAADDGSWGIGLLNDGRYGHSLREDGTMTLTLVRSIPAHKSSEQTDEGVHEVTYSIVPHADRWEDAGVVQAAHALNAPVVAQREIPHAGSRHHAASMIRVGQENIVLAAVKQAQEANDEIVLHLYETTGRKTDAMIEFGREPVSACECDFIEWNDGDGVEIDGSTLRRTFRPWEMAAIRVRFE